MTNNKNFAVVGHGSFGSVWSSDIEDNPESNLSSVIDTDPIDSDEVPGNPTIKQEDYTEAIDIQRSKDGNLEYEVSNENLLEDLSNIDQAVVATDTDAHLKLGLTLAEAEVDMMLEKPPTESPEETELLLEAANENDVETGVNMIERQHPAYRAAQEVFGDEDIGRMFNYRSKDLRGNERGKGGGEGSRITMEDLIHDLSEIEGLTETGLKKATVEDAEIERWSEIGEFPYNTDVRAKASVQYEDGTELDLNGSFADEERRYFIAVNEEENKAVYVNTLSRDHISPQAAVIDGEKEVGYLERVAREGLILDDEIQEELLESLDADKLDDEMEDHVPESKYVDGKPKFGWAPVYNQVEQMTSDEEPVSSLEEVLGYQKTMEEIYEESGKPSAANPKW
jgi:predicted dehydrogenase